MPYGWFCVPHYKVKEAAYKEARDKGMTNHLEIMALRGRRLKESKVNE